MIRALNRNLPYDAFVRTQVSGYESSTREEVSATGFRRKFRPRPDSQFALGFLARGATSRSNDDHQNTGPLGNLKSKTIPASEIEAEIRMVSRFLGSIRCYKHLRISASQSFLLGL